jgi:hypothetical protein
MRLVPFYFPLRLHRYYLSWRGSYGLANYIMHSEKVQWGDVEQTDEVENFRLAGEGLGSLAGASPG